MRSCACDARARPHLRCCRAKDRAGLRGARGRCPGGPGGLACHLSGGWRIGLTHCRYLQTEMPHLATLTGGCPCAVGVPPGPQPALCCIGD